MNEDYAFHNCPVIRDDGCSLVSNVSGNAFNPAMDTQTRRHRPMVPMSRELNSLRDYLTAPTNFEGSASSVASVAERPGEGSSEGGDSLSSRSSIISSDVYFPFGNIQQDASVLANEVRAFLDDLNNYLALGCLCFEDYIQRNGEAEIPGWQDITDRPPVLALDETLNNYLEKLAAARWIRVYSRRSITNPRYIILRVYILPADVGLRYVDRQNKRLHSALEGLVRDIHVSALTWSGSYDAEKATKFDMWATSEEGSLFWMFNKIPSPAPSADLVKEKYAHNALEDLLDPTVAIPGLKTQLYPYQRRSAGLMLQRESMPDLELDPRLERRIAPDGTEYYYGARGVIFLRHPRCYKACRGGILAETMGLGKTVICLAVILATKDHPPKIPDQYNLTPVRKSTATLFDMALSIVHRKAIPWKLELDGLDLSGNFQKLKSPPTYEIPLQPMRRNRMTVERPPRKLMMANTTIIIAPPNLTKQWLSEIHKHTEADLRVLTMDSSKKPLPAAEEICTYDIVLFTRTRFEAENKDGADEQGRRLGTTQRFCRCPYIGATRVRDCNCLRTDELYESPLKLLHFKRLIVDEGHFFSNTTNTSVSVANKLIVADARWVVSGTPAKDLLGVEVDMTSSENLWQTPNTKESRDAVLEQRRPFNVKIDSVGAIKSLGALATNFLKTWSMPDNSESALWDDYIFRHEALHKKTYSGFSTGLKRMLHSMVVKTQPQDVEIDLQLPPLYHEVVRLQPSFYDKLTANLFTLVLTANAVTSERTDVDYLFHKNSQKARSQLIANLRQSAFFWTGFSEADVLACVKSSRRYFGKRSSKCTKLDRRLLMRTLKAARPILASDGWKALSRSHEVGLFVDDWPSSSAEHWAFDGSQSPLLTGISQLLEAQNYVNDRMSSDDPGEGLSGAGIKAVAPARHGTIKQEEPDSPKAEKQILTKSGIPTSSIDGEPLLRRRSSSGAKASPRKMNKPFKVVKSQRQKKDRKTNTASNNEEVAPGRTREVPFPGLAAPALNGDVQFQCLPSDSPYLRTRVVGTTSAKLSYLMSQVLKYYKNEKILIFYDGENAAYYIAQMLELLNIKHNIYAKSLAAHLKSEYVVRFDQEQDDRVLLMDVRNAAHGLNLASSSRIYFVNPTCRPNIEAQAIKRAHRIGQTKPVYVETLVLRGTIEEKMLERSKRMTQQQHRDANHLEDDLGIRDIIQGARVLQLSNEECVGRGQMAPLETAQPLWCREGYDKFSRKSFGQGASQKKRKLDDMKREDDTGIDSPRNSSEGRSVVRRTLAFVDGGEVHQHSDRYEIPTTPGSPEISIHPQFDGPSPLRSLGDPLMPSMASDRLIATNLSRSHQEENMTCTAVTPHPPDSLAMHR